MKYNLPFLRMEINTSNQIFINVHEKQFNDRENYYTTKRVTTNHCPVRVENTVYTILMWSMTFLI